MAPTSARSDARRGAAKPAAARRIAFTLNGEPRTLDVEPAELLLDVLRDRLGLKSAKSGCERGDCGACTVLFDGRTVRSCLVLAVEADGCTLTTVEGLAKGGPTPLQRVLIERNAFQCGFCAPGVVLSATELLDRHAAPTREDIQEALGGNLCRCTGYASIVDAIEAAAALRAAAASAAPAAPKRARRKP